MTISIGDKTGVGKKKFLLLTRYHYWLDNIIYIYICIIKTWRSSTDFCGSSELRVFRGRCAIGHSDSWDDLQCCHGHCILATWFHKFFQMSYGSWWNPYVHGVFHSKFPSFYQVKAQVSTCFHPPPRWRPSWAAWAVLRGWSTSILSRPRLVEPRLQKISFGASKYAVEWGYEI